MASPAMSVGDLLVNAGVASSGSADADWTVKIGRWVDTVDRMIVVFDSPGEAPDPKWLLDYPRFQVVVRGRPGEYDVAWQKAKDCKDVLVGMTPQDINGDRFDGILGVGDIAFLKYDEKERPLFSMNYRSFFEPAQSALTQRQPL